MSDKAVILMLNNMAPYPYFPRFVKKYTYVVGALYFIVLIHNKMHRFRARYVILNDNNYLPTIAIKPSNVVICFRPEAWFQKYANPTPSVLLYNC